MMQPVPYTSPYPTPPGVVISQPGPSGDGCCRKAAPGCAKGLGITFIVFGVLTIIFASWGLGFTMDWHNSKTKGLFSWAIICGFVVRKLFMCHKM